MVSSHSVSLSLREFWGFIACLIGFFCLFLSVECPLIETRTYGVTSNMVFSFTGYSMVYLDPLKLFPAVFAAVAGAYLQWFS